MERRRRDPERVGDLRRGVVTGPREIALLVGRLEGGRLAVGERLALSVAYLLVPLRRRLRRRFSRLTSTLAVTALVGVIAAALPVLLIKLTLFVLLVFSLLHNQQDIRSGVLTVVPPNYRDIAESLHTRARETLFALYVLQAATAIGTFLIALPPDLLIRPRIASRTADMNGSLYFIGFIGGLLSLGAIGIIVGPLVVALLVEAAGLVAQEFETSVDTPPEPTTGRSDESAAADRAESAVDD